MELIVERRYRGHGQPPSARRFRRRLLLGAAILLPLATVAAYFFLLPRATLRYRAWHQHRALTQARDFAQLHDGANASLALQVALRDDAASPEVWRVAAELLEQAGNAQAVSVRRDILRLPSATSDDRLALVLTAIRFGDLTTAGDTLHTIPLAERNSPASRRVAVQFAFASNQPALAHALLDALARDTPADKSLQFALAALRLRLPQPEAAQAARTEVEVFARHSEFTLPALRELTLDALFRRDTTAAPRYATQLTGAPGATFNDRLTAANVALLLENRPLASVLAALAPAAASSGDRAAQFTSWLLAQNRPDEAIAFIHTLPAALAKSPAILGAHATAVASRGDWRALGDLLRDGAWGPVAPEIVDLAFSAHTVDERSRPELRRNLWQEALRAAQPSLPSLRVLHRLAARWAWNTERIDALQAITTAFPRELSAHESLAREFVAAKSTANLQQALFRWMEADPTNLRVKNDWALLAMIREPSDQPDRPKDVAAELHRAAPANPYFLTAHAFALMQLGHADDALALVEKLSPAEREFPARAPYLAAIYLAADRTDTARRALDLAPVNTLLPEEAALVQATRTQLGSPVSSPFR